MASIPFEVHGSVAAGYEPIRELFARNQQRMAEKNTQLCIYVGEEKVVDLWSSTTADPDFGPDSLVNIFSSGKSLEAIAIATLVDQGLLDYQQKICHYWPEFAGGGKGELRVADLMRHEAGMAAFDVSVVPEDLLTENIKQNRIGEIIEPHELKYRAGEDNQREYHAITRGWIVNEVFRRVDAKGRTIGEFLREEVSAPLEADVHVGLRETELARVSPLVPVEPRRHILHSMRPGPGRRVRDNSFQLAGKLLPLLPRLRLSTTRDAPPMFEGLESFEDFNNPVIAMGETPSAASNSSARGLARLAALMANGGRLGDVELMSSKGWDALHAEPIDRNMGFDSIFTQGGVAQFQQPGPGASMLTRGNNIGREGFYGWMGLGGSIFQWHPGKRIGFAFVPTSLHVLDLVNERGKVYQQAVQKLVR